VLPGRQAVCDRRSVSSYAFSDTGTIIAAATTSIPSRSIPFAPGLARWLRDTASSLALRHQSLRGGRALSVSCATSPTRALPALHIGGERNLVGLPHLAGIRGVGPVRMAAAYVRNSTT
jgi:hypothetical protein